MGAGVAVGSALLQQVLARHAGEPGALLPILHDAQDRLGFVPRDLVPQIALALNLSRAEVHGVVTYDHHFRSEPPSTAPAADLPRRGLPGDQHQGAAGPSGGTAGLQSAWHVGGRQLMPVMQPSAWQQEYSRFNRVQQELLQGHAQTTEAVPAK